MTAWIVVVAVGAGSYLFRISMLVVAARAGLSPTLERVARHAVPVSFAALAASALTGHLTQGGATLAPLGAIAVGVTAVRRTGSAHAAIAAGMPTLWVLSAVLPE